MTYQEFLNEYKTVLNKYPGLCGIYEYSGKITLTEEGYVKNKNKWELIEKLPETNVAYTYLVNCVSMCRYLRCYGGWERVELNYTFAGYLPTKVISISPDKSTKIVYKFKIEKATL